MLLKCFTNERSKKYPQELQENVTKNLRVSGENFELVLVKLKNNFVEILRNLKVNFGSTLWKLRLIWET